MTPYRRALLRRAIHLAAETRAKRGRSLDRPLCVFDLADELELTVEFKRYTTKGYEGILMPGVKTIHLEPERPSGRQRFTCAHEIGHFLMRHGHVAACTTEEWSLLNTTQEELLANVFASFLLMPKFAVMRAFGARSRAPETADAVDFYVIAGWFGVGYTNLLWHCYRNIEVLSSVRYDQLKKANLAKVREAILDGKIKAGALSKGLRVVSADWTDRPIDLAIGERVLFQRPVGAELPAALSQEHAHPGCYIAVAAGKGIAQDDSGWSSIIRVYDGKREGLWRALWDIEEGD